MNEEQEIVEDTNDLNLKKQFDPTKRYKVGVLRTKDKSKPTLTFYGDYPQFVKTGKHFIENGCKDTDTYWNINPDHLSPKVTFTIAVVDNNGRYKYFDEGTPNPPNANSGIQQQYSQMQAPVSLGNLGSDDSRGTLYQNDMLPQSNIYNQVSPEIKEFFEKQLQDQRDIFERSQENLRTMFDQRIADKDEKINQLLNEIQELRNSNGHTPEFIKNEMEEKNKQIANLTDMYDAQNQAFTAKINNLLDEIRAKESEIVRLNAEITHRDEMDEYHDKMQSQIEKETKGLADDLANMKKSRLDGWMPIIQAFAVPFVQKIGDNPEVMQKILGLFNVGNKDGNQPQQQQQQEIDPESIRKVEEIIQESKAASNSQSGNGQQFVPDHNIDSQYDNEDDTGVGI